MSNIRSMLKMNLKLLFRQKGYLCFLGIVPLVAVLLLNIPQTDSFDYGSSDHYSVHELKKNQSTPLSMSNTRLSMKVYDSSDSVSSNYLLSQLAKNGSYNIYRYKSKHMTSDEIEEDAVISANANNIGTILYIPENFGTKENSSGIVIFKISDDQRVPFLQSSIETIVKSLNNFRDIADEQKGLLEEVISEMEKEEMKKEVTSVSVGNDLNLSNKQQSQSSNIGYSISIVSIGFLFTGIFIASIVINEKDNGVLTRIYLTNTNTLAYISVKLILTLITVIIQTLIMGVGIFLFVKTDYGIPFGSYLFIVFGLGLIFNTFSVVAGVLTDNALSANYIAFFVWCFTSLLSGLYFPIGGDSFLEKISLIMPQRWAIKTGELLMAGESAYPLFVMVTCGYALIILCIGFMGMKMLEKK